MRRDRGAGILRLQFQQFGFRESLVDNADPRPQQHLAIEPAGEITAEMAVRAEDDLLALGYLVEDRLGR